MQSYVTVAACLCLVIGVMFGAGIFHFPGVQTDDNVEPDIEYYALNDLLNRKDFANIIWSITGDNTSVEGNPNQSGTGTDTGRLEDDTWVEWNGIINCPRREECLSAKQERKNLRRHVWENYKDMAYAFTHTEKGKNIYKRRKETVERSFYDSKELHDKVCLVFALSEEVFAQTSPSTDHLHKLDLALYGLEEHKVHDSRNVDAGVKHIHRYCDAEFIVILKFQNKIIRIFHVVVDQLAVVRRMLRVQFVEAINDHTCFDLNTVFIEILHGVHLFLWVKNKGIAFLRYLRIGRYLIRMIG